MGICRRISDRTVAGGSQFCADCGDTECNCHNDAEYHAEKKALSKTGNRILDFESTDTGSFSGNHNGWLYGKPYRALYILYHPESDYIGDKFFDTLLHLRRRCCKDSAVRHGCGTCIGVDRRHFFVL